MQGIDLSGNELVCLSGIGKLIINMKEGKQFELNFDMSIWNIRLYRKN